MFVLWKETAGRIVEGIVIALAVSYGERVIEHHFSGKYDKSKKKKRKK